MVYPIVNSAAKWPVLIMLDNLSFLLQKVMDAWSGREETIKLICISKQTYINIKDKLSQGQAFQGFFLIEY